jgi:hypothetical protein
MRFHSVKKDPLLEAKMQQPNQRILKLNRTKQKYLDNQKGNLNVILELIQLHGQLSLGDPQLRIKILLKLLFLQSSPFHSTLLECRSLSIWFMLLL